MTIRVGMPLRRSNGERVTTSWDTFDDDVTRPYRPTVTGSGHDDAPTAIDDDLTTPFRPGAATAPPEVRPLSQTVGGIEIAGDGLAIVVPDPDARRPDPVGPGERAATQPLWAQSPPGSFRPWEPAPRPTLLPTMLRTRRRGGGRTRLLIVAVAALALSAVAGVLVLRLLGWLG